MSTSWTDPAALATLALGGATVLLAVVVVIDGWRHRRHDARQRVLQRRHDHLQGAYAALIRSVVLAMELQRSRRLITRLVNGLPPVLSSPVGRDESLISTEFIGSLAESMSWLRTIHPDISSAEFDRLAKAEEALIQEFWGQGKHLVRFLDAAMPVRDALKARLLELDVDP